MAAPLNKLLTKNQPAKLSSFTLEQTQSFKKLKQALVEPPVLSLPRQGLPFSMDADGSDY